jgi:hypothetical protein
MRSGDAALVFSFLPSTLWGEGDILVQTGNIVYRINRAHGLQCVGMEEGADAVEGNQCHGPKNSVDS